MVAVPEHHQSHQHAACFLGAPALHFSYSLLCALLPSIKRYKAFKEYSSRILVTTDLFGRGIDIERVNIVINYDFPAASDHGEGPSDCYLHRVGRAGRFGTKGLAISFVSSTEDEAALEAVQKRFEVSVPELPDEIDQKDYMQ